MKKDSGPPESAPHPPGRRKKNPGRPGKGAPGKPRASRKKGEKADAICGSSDVAQMKIAPDVDHYFDAFNDGIPRNTNRTKRIGRPPEYEEIYDEWVLAWGARGKSVAWMAAEIGCSKTALDRWATVYESFSTSLARAKLLSQAWWEDSGASGIREQVFRGDVWKVSMSCRFPDDWREQKTVTMKADEGFAALWSAVAKGAVILPVGDDVTSEKPKDEDEY